MKRSYQADGSLGRLVVTARPSHFFPLCGFLLVLMLAVKVIAYSFFVEVLFSYFTSFDYIFSEESLFISRCRKVGEFSSFIIR